MLLLTPGNSRRASPKDQYYANKFEFSDLVLSWRLEEIKAAGTETDCISLLPKYDLKNMAEYFNRFKPLIIAETKDELKTGFEGIESGKTKSTVLTLSKFTPAKNQKNPTILMLQGSLSDEFGFGNDVVLLRNVRSNRIYIGITCRKSDINSAKSELVIKTKGVELSNPGIVNDFVDGSQWMVYILGCLVTQMREYDICQIQPKLSFEENFITGVYKSSPHRVAFKLSDATHFNTSQVKAIEDFTNLQNGLQILQGPPGTGKTTTIVQLLNSLVARRERILVCAPSNKAVQVLAARFLRDFPETKMVLAGRHEKLTDELKPIFVDNYRDQLSALVKSLQDIAGQKQLINPSDTRTKINIKNRFKAIKEIYSRFELILNNLKHFYILDRLEFEPYHLCAKSIDNIGPVKAKEELLEILNKLNTNVNSLHGKISRLEDLDILLLNRAQVIFCTLSVAGRSRMKLIDKVSTLIVDEAAQATEVDTIIPFQHLPNKCLLVGDTKQLPAVVTSELAKKCHFDWSMMHRLVEECKYPHNTLKIQYRMHADIRSWPSRRFYNNLLQDGANIANRPVFGLPKEFEPYGFINVANYQEQKNGKSFMNRGEAKLIASMLKYLQNQGINIAQQVGIITFYSGQVECLKQELGNWAIRGVTPQTVDGFQGDEKDIILISFVRSNNRQNVGFLSDFRRLNVAITRAKNALIMVGNFKTLQGDTDLKSLLVDAKQRRCVHDSNSIGVKYWPTAQQLRQQQGSQQERAPQGQLHQQQLRQEQARHEQLRQQQLQQERVRQEQIRQQQLQQERARQEQLHKLRFHEEQMRQQHRQQLYMFQNVSRDPVVQRAQAQKEQTSAYTCTVS